MFSFAQGAGCRVQAACTHYIICKYHSKILETKSSHHAYREGRRRTRRAAHARPNVGRFVFVRRPEATLIRVA